MPTPTPLPKPGPGPGSSSAGSQPQLDHQSRERITQDPINCFVSESTSIPPQQSVTPSSSSSSSPGPFIHHARGTTPGSPSESSLDDSGPLSPLGPDHYGAATGAGIPSSRPGSRLRTPSCSSGHFVSMTAAPAPDSHHSRHVSTAVLENDHICQHDLALLHVDRTVARLSRLLATVVESPEAQSMLQPLLRRNILLAQFSLAVLKSAPTGPMHPMPWQQLQHRQSSHLRQHPPFLATQSQDATKTRPELQRTHVSSPAILLTGPSRRSQAQEQLDTATADELQNGDPDEVWNLAEDLAAIASLLCDLANPRHITVSLDCPNVILPFHGPHLLSSRHLILVAGYCLGIIADHGHVAISLHWPNGWGAETSMQMGEHQSPEHPATAAGASSTTAAGEKEGVNIGSFAGTQEMDAENRHPIVCIRASPVLPHYQKHVPTVADLPTPFVSSVRMRCRVNQPESQQQPSGASAPIPPTARRTSSTAPIPTSPLSPPGFPDIVQTSPIENPSTDHDLLESTLDSISRPTSQTSSLESSDLTTASTSASDQLCSLFIEIQLPLTSVPRSVGSQSQSRSLCDPPVLIHAIYPPTPASPPIFPAGTHPGLSPPKQSSDNGTKLETRTNILESFATSLNGHPIGCFPSAAVLHPLRAVGVIPYPIRNVSHFPRLSVVHLPSHLLKLLVTALRQLPRQEPIGLLAILDSDDQVVDVFEWLDAATTASAAVTAPHVDRERLHTHLDGSHNLVLHIAPNPPCTLLLLESLIVLNATLHVFQGVRGAASAATGGVTGAMQAASGASPAAAKSKAVGLASPTTSSVRHWRSPAPASSPMATSPGLLSPTDPAIAEWERTMDMLAEACGVSNEGSFDSTRSRRVNEVPAPPCAPPPQCVASSSSSSSVALDPSSRVMSPLPQYPGTSPTEPASIHRYTTLHPAHHPQGPSPPTAIMPIHRRITLSNIPESITAIGLKLLSPYVSMGDTGLFPSSPAKHPATPAYSFSSDAQRLWSPLVPMRSLTMGPTGMYPGSVQELQLPSVAAGLRPPPTAPFEAPIGMSGKGRRHSVLKRKTDESLRELFPLVRVLVVEDDPIATRILSIFLARRSIDHITATTGPQAIHHFTCSGPFHVVFMNLGLAQQPGQDAMDGLECTRLMRQFELEHSHGGGHAARGILPPAVIIALTADTSTDTHRAALVAGCNDVAVKPVRLRWIEDKLVEVAALMGLVQPAMAIRELAAVVSEKQHGQAGEGEETENLRRRRDRSSTWTDLVKRDAGAVQVGVGEPAPQRRRSVSAGVHVADGLVDVSENALWGGGLNVEGRAARARTGSYQGPSPVCVEAPATGDDEAGSSTPSNSVSVEE